MDDARFESAILTAIIYNSVLMAIEDYEDPGKHNGNPTSRNHLVSHWYQSAPPRCALKLLAGQQT